LQSGVVALNSLRILVESPMRAPAVLVTALIVLAAPMALAVEHKCPPAGTEIRTTLLAASSKPIRSEGQEGLWCLRSLNGQPINSEIGHLSFFPRSQQASDAAREYSAAAAELWPLTPGKTASFQFRHTGDGSSAAADAGNYIHRVEFTVEPPRELTVPAGTFRVLPIVYDVRGTGKNYHHGRYTYYYAPDLATNVKFEYKIIQGSNARPPQPWELVSIKTPGK
jgi:hypothetical protein